MQLIIFGETHRIMNNSEKYIDLIKENSLKNSFVKNISEFKNNHLNKTTLYDNIDIKNNSLNFFNYKFDDNSKTLKRVIDYELARIELNSKDLGSLLTEWLVDFYVKHPYQAYALDREVCKDFITENILNKLNNLVERPNKNHLNEIIKNIESKKNKNIIKSLIKNIDADDTVFVKESFNEKTFIKKTDQIKFNFEFDNSFLLDKKEWHAENYKYIIIDGFIDSVGEIHHLLQKSYEDKECYVVFCKGMHEEVKATILQNLKRKTINVMPVSLKVNEENVNILNDIAACHDNDIISAHKGDVISIAVKRELKRGKRITIDSDGIVLQYKDKRLKDKQLEYLTQKVNDTIIGDPNIDYLNKRIKNLNSKKVEIFLDSRFTKRERTELDAYLRSINYIKSGAVFFKDNKRILNYRELIVGIVKFTSLIKTIESFGCALVEENK